MPNAIPSKVVVENMVRAATIDAVIATNEKINRAMAGAAAAMGAGLKITDRAGYSPLYNNWRMGELFCQAAGLLDPDHPIEPGTEWSTGCTDMGDVSAFMPVLHPYCKGAAGPAHSDDYRIESVEKACVNSAKVQLVLTELLLGKGAAEAKAIVADYRPVYSSLDDYRADLDKLMIDKDAVKMNQDGTITLNYKE